MKEILHGPGILAKKLFIDTFQDKFKFFFLLRLFRPSYGVFFF